jgi:hypothetical protein
VNLHSIKEYVIYRWAALGRHGVHSPFAYHLVDIVLPECSKAGAVGALNDCTWLPRKYKSLASGLADRYNYTNIKLLENEQEEPAGKYQLLVLNNAIPGQWVRLFNRYCNHMQPNSIIMVAGIHNSPRHTAKWQRLCKHPRVMMSVDLYGAGLIFFRSEFREKQHFILRY